MTRNDLLMQSIRPLLSADAKPLQRDDECLVAGLTTKMRLKRAVLFAILIVTLFSGYYFYTLHFQPRSDIDEIQQLQQQQNRAFFQGQRIAFRLRPKDGNSGAQRDGDTGRKDSRAAIPLYPQGMRGVDETRRDRARGFRLFPKGIAKEDALGAEQELLERTTAWNRGDGGGGEQGSKLGDEDLVTPGNAGQPYTLPAVHRDDDDDELSPKLKQQQEMIAWNRGDGGGGEQGSKLGDEDLVTPGNAGQPYTLPAVHRDDDDDELSPKLKQQQEMIERQEKLLQQLQEQVLKQNAYKTAPATQFRGRQEPADNAQLQPRGPVTVWRNTPAPATTRPATADRFQRPFTDGIVGANVRVPEDKSAYQANSLLERVESFNGEIKGKFNGVIMKEGDDAAIGRMKLAINGIQPMAASRRRQGGPADQNPPPESPIRDPETASEQTRQRGAAVANNEPSQRSHTPEAPAKLQQTAGPRIKTESAALEADDSNGQDSAGNEQHPHDKDDDEGHVVEKVIDVHRVQIPWEPSTEAAAEAAGELPDGAGQAAWKGNKDWRHRLVTTRPGPRRYAAAAGADLENKVEEVVEKRGNDELLEDRFEEVKNDLQNIKPGREPEVQMDESNNKNVNRYAKTDNRYAKTDHRYAKTDERGNSRNSFNNNNNDNNKGPVLAKPEARLKVTVFNLSQPAVGSFHCVPLRLHGLSRTICISSRDKDASQSSRLIHRGSWEEKELDEFLAALSTSSSLGAVDLGAGECLLAWSTGWWF